MASLKPLLGSMKRAAPTKPTAPRNSWELLIDEIAETDIPPPSAVEVSVDIIKELFLSNAGGSVAGESGSRLLARIKQQQEKGTIPKIYELDGKFFWHRRFDIEYGSISPADGVQEGRDTGESTSSTHKTIVPTTKRELVSAIDTKLKTLGQRDLGQVLRAVAAIEASKEKPLFAVNRWAERSSADKRTAIEFYYDEYGAYRGMDRPTLHHVDLPLYDSVVKWLARTDPSKHPDYLAALAEPNRPRSGVFPRTSKHAAKSKPV